MKHEWNLVELVANGTISLVRESLQDGDDRQEPQPIGFNLRQGKEGPLELALAWCQPCLWSVITGIQLEKIRGSFSLGISPQDVLTSRAEEPHPRASPKHATVNFRLHRQAKEIQFNTLRLSIPRN